MTTSLKTARDARESIVLECDLPHRPAKVWRALTDPEILSRWLMANDIRAEVGHRFTFKGKSVEDWDGVVHAEVLAVEPRRRLRYTWRGGLLGVAGGGAKLETVVTWTLTAIEGGTRLRLDHDGFPAASLARSRIGDEWRRLVTTCLNGLLARLPDPA
jgi:uncharacterized protein YndB with AHSA1/START domain